MKYLIAASLVLYFNIALAQNEKSFVLKGIIKNGNGKKVWLKKSGLYSNLLIDSIILNDTGAFVLKVKTDEESFYKLTWGSEDNEKIEFINDGSNISIEGDASNTKSFIIQGSQAISNLITLSTLLQEKDILYDSINIVKTNLSESDADKEAKNNYTQQLKIIIKEKRDILFKYYTSTQSPKLQFCILIYAFYNMPSESMSFNYIDSLLNESLKKYSEDGELKFLKSALAQTKEKPAMKKRWIGEPFPSLSLPDKNGNMINISNFRGKYVLIYFWSGWCASCLKDNVYLIKAVKKFQKKDFNIIGISFGTNKREWTKTIAKAKLVGIQIREPKEFIFSKIGEILGGDDAPSNFLLNPNGTIIALNLYGENLETKLKEVLN